MPTSTRLWMMLVVAASGGCIIADAGINVQEQRVNPGAIRIVYATPLSSQVEDECRAVSGLPCPLPPLTGVYPGEIAIEGQPLCTCPAGQVDGNALGAFDIFAEDPDLDVNNEPADDLRAALLLDPPTDPVTNVSALLAYENYLNPELPALLSSQQIRPIERPEPLLRFWTLGADTRVDLCNDDNGRRLAPGIHALRVIASDRDWYVRVQTDDLGRPIVRDDGSFVRTDEDPLPGIPDLPAGATYDIINFVFECGNGTENPDACNCIAEDL